MKQLAAALASGVLFAVGLAVSGMTQPAKVIGFLDIGGAWDPSLALVMVGAIGVAAIGWRLAQQRQARGAIQLTHRPSARIDVPLVAGAALFGVGWGLSGFCPGPALESAFVGRPAALVFAPAMLAGMLLYRLSVRRPARVDETSHREAGKAEAACA